MITTFQLEYVLPHLIAINPLFKDTMGEGGFTPLNHSRLIWQHPDIVKVRQVLEDDHFVRPVTLRDIVWDNSTSDALKALRDGAYTDLVLWIPQSRGRWGELRPRIEEMLTGDVNVLLTPKGKRLCFTLPEDYALARLMF